MLPRLTLALGGAASGKSNWAENLLLGSHLAPVYLATSRVLDDEIKMRVDAHKSRRCDRWTSYEAPLDLGPVLSERESGEAVLVDCATMWLTNHMLDGTDIAAAQSQFLTALDACPAPVIVVSNDVGCGIVPDNALAREFRDRQGRLNIALAAQAQLVVQVIAGLPLVLKGTLP